MLGLVGFLASHFPRKGPGDMSGTEP